MSRHGPNTPGVAGYLLAALIADVLFAAGLYLPVLADETVTWQDALFWAFLLAFFVTLYSVPFAALGLLAVHVACVRVPAQWVHVLAAGAAGLLPMVVFSVMTQQWEVVPFAGVPVATALGRWAVVPLVRQRRDSAGPRATG